MSRAGRRTWCCGAPIGRPHVPGCSFEPRPDNPIDYGGACTVTQPPPNPTEFGPGTEFRVSWEMPPANVTAFEYEDRYGEGVWLRLSAEQWAGLPWAPSENVTTDYEAALDQYRQLARWADSHEQPIRNVRIEWRPPAAWTELVGLAPAGPPNPAPHLASDWGLGIDGPTYGGRYA